MKKAKSLKNYINASRGLLTFFISKGTFFELFGLSFHCEIFITTLEALAGSSHLLMMSDEWMSPYMPGVLLYLWL